MHSNFKISLTILLLFCHQLVAQSSIDSLKPFATVGLFFGNVSEGARMFTPVRLLPFDLPESQGHQFPTVLQLHGTEYPFLILLGEKIGLKLRATLQRYPTQPDSQWPYPQFTEPPLEEFRQAELTHQIDSSNSIPGLRIVALYRNVPVGFIIDTRNLTLSERHMRSPTTMGLDINRNDLLKAFDQIAARLSKNAKASIVIIDP